MTMNVAPLEHKCNLRIYAHPAGAVVSFTGALDWHAVRDYLTAVADAGEPRRLLVDLTETSWLDSAGTSALIATFLRERRSHLEVAIAAGPSIAAVLREVGLGEVVPVFLAKEQGEAWLFGTTTDVLQSDR